MSGKSSWGLTATQFGSRLNREPSASGIQVKKEKHRDILSPPHYRVQLWTADRFPKPNPKGILSLLGQQRRREEGAIKEVELVSSLLLLPGALTFIRRRMLLLA